MKEEELESFLEPIFTFYRDQRQKNESFGEFCNRVGFDQIRAYMDNPGTKAAKEETSDGDSATSDDNQERKTKAKTMTTKAKSEQDSSEKKAKKTKESAGRKIRYRVGVHDEMYEMLKGIAAEEDKSMTQLVDEALNSYLDGRK
jgi:sulfite reductase (ferredoxin)